MKIVEDVAAPELDPIGGVCDRCGLMAYEHARSGDGAFERFSTIDIRIGGEGDQLRGDLCEHCTDRFMEQIAVWRACLRPIAHIDEVRQRRVHHFDMIDRAGSRFRIDSLFPEPDFDG